MTARGPSLRTTGRIACTLILAVTLASPLTAQDGSDSKRGVALLPDGNGVPALRTFVSDAFDNLPVRDALTIVAVRARLNITFDARLPEVETRITIPAHDRTAANALLEIARIARLRVNVLPSGQLLVLLPVPPKPQLAERPADSVATPARVYQLPAMHAEETRPERLDFDLKPNVGTLSVTGRDMSAASHFVAQADLLRAVQLLPGVEALNDYNSGFNVRGGDADQNLILLDGYPIYNPFHLGGLFGTFIDPMVGRVELNSGGFPAQFDGRLSSVLNVTSAEEPRTGLHGNGEFSLISSTLSLGSSIDSGSGTWMVAGRRTYADAFAAALGSTVPYHFQDGQAHFSHALRANARFDVTGYTGLDEIAVSNSTDLYRVAWGNQVLGATYSQLFPQGLPFLGRRLGDSARIEQRVSVSHFGLDANVASGSLTLHSEDDDLRVAGSLTAYGASHTRSIGYDVSSEHLGFSASQAVPIFPTSSFLQRNLSAGLFYEDIWRPTHSLLLDMGLRAEGLAETRWSAVLPRLSAKYFLNENVAITGAFGEYAQWVRSLARDDVPIRVMDIWIGSDSVTPVSRSRHYELGVERWVTPQRMFRVEGFYKIYRDLIEPNPRDDPQQYGDEFLPVDGRTYGVDFLLRQFDTGRFAGWMSYTYAVTTQTDPDGYKYFPQQDRRHDLNLVGTWRSGSWAFNARFNLASGTPYTNVVGEFRQLQYNPFQQAYQSSLVYYSFLFGPKDAERLPISHRLDLSVSNHWSMGGLTISPYLSMANAYNARNVLGYTFDYTKSPPTRISLPQFPLLPTLGATVAW